MELNNNEINIIIKNMKARRIGFAALGIAVAFGFKFYNKSATAKNVKQDLLSICSTDNNCQNAVSTHFKKCFDSSYSMGGRRRSGRLDTRKLSTCINNNSGANYFGS